MGRRPPSAGEIVGADRAIGLVRKLGAPDGEAGVALRQAVEGVMEGALAEEDDPVGPAGTQSGGKIVETGRGDMADEKVAAARPGGVADPGEQLEQERVVDLRVAP